MVRGRTALVLLGAIPLVTAGCVWMGFYLADDLPRRAEKGVMFTTIALGLLAIAVLAWRHGAGRWTPLWVLGGGASGIVWFYVIALMLFSFGGDHESVGCPKGKIYC